MLERGVAVDHSSLAHWERSYNLTTYHPHIGEHAKPGEARRVGDRIGIEVRVQWNVNPG